MKNVVIVGGGTAGWMAANLLVKQFPAEQVNVTLVESPTIGIVGVGEGSTPTLKRFFQLIDVHESDWMVQCNATYKVNIRFVGWSPNAPFQDYSHPFFSQVDTFTERAFEVNTQTRRLGLDTHVKPDDFFLNGILAAQGKGPLTPDNFPFRMEYGYHFDSHLLGNYLKNVAIQRGVRHISDEVIQVNRHANGDVSTLTLAKHAAINGDFFIDCSGFSSLLMQQTLGVTFKSFSDNLFNNAAVVLPSAAQKELPVETRSTALKNGWCWSIPLTNRTGNGYVYSDAFTSKDDAEVELRSHLKIGEAVEARHLKMKVGQLTQHWAHNCLGLGLSQGFIEPLEATALHLVQVSIEMFIDKWKEGGLTPQHRDTFNRDMTQRFEHVRDYIVAHYKLNTRDDSEYWRANRNNSHFSDSLGHILDVWFKRGDVRQEIQRQNLQTHFNSSSWHCLLAGYGAFPRLAAKQPGTGDLYIEKQVKHFLSRCALNFDSHQRNLTQHQPQRYV
ncbi:tryptophan halogenase family protein [Alteromonas oceanisediminis]|uniref:tryptophan halogenase family protein n=1 Tax=Alteromonas oceanisediminis TaxID=2836180 RepID=UPI001BD98A56|nr:tryptophan halogenase family protein [Alteromonas oceanisediminis]MBT0586471.1 tryptophan 7-halogenase [Alteromonas oceanisediminis]